MNRTLLFLLFLVFSASLVSCRHGGDKKVSLIKTDSTALRISEKARHDSLSAELARFLEDPCFKSAIVGYAIYDFT